MTGEIKTVLSPTPAFLWLLARDHDLLWGNFPPFVTCQTQEPWISGTFQQPIWHGNADDLLALPGTPLPQTPDTLHLFKPDPPLRPSKAHQSCSLTHLCVSAWPYLSHILLHSQATLDPISMAPAWWNLLVLFEKLQVCTRWHILCFSIAYCINIRYTINTRNLHIQIFLQKQLKGQDSMPHLTFTSPVTVIQGESLRWNWGWGT